MFLAINHNSCIFLLQKFPKNYNIQGANSDLEQYICIWFWNVDKLMQPQIETYLADIGSFISFLKVFDD